MAPGDCRTDHGSKNQTTTHHTERRTLYGCLLNEVPQHLRKYRNNKKKGRVEAWLVLIFTFSLFKYPRQKAAGKQTMTSNIRCEG